MSERERVAADALGRLERDLLDLTRLLAEAHAQLAMIRASLNAGREEDPADPLTAEDRQAVREAEEEIARGDFVDEALVADELARRRQSRA